MTVHRDKFRIIKPTRCTDFSDLFLGWNSTCFGQFLCPSSGGFHCTHSSGICHTGMLCVQWKTPDDGQRNCPKHVDFHFKNKFEKLMHLVGIIIRNLSRFMFTWTSNIYAALQILKYLYVHFGNRHVGWQATFGSVTSFTRIVILIFINFFTHGF